MYVRAQVGFKVRDFVLIRIVDLKKIFNKLFESDSDNFLIFGFCIRLKKESTQ
jgi:hypothetical protein